MLTLLSGYLHSAFALVVLSSYALFSPFCSAAMSVPLSQMLTPLLTQTLTQHQSSPQPQVKPTCLLLLSSTLLASPPISSICFGVSLPASQCTRSSHSYNPSYSPLILNPSPVATLLHDCTELHSHHQQTLWPHSITADMICYPTSIVTTQTLMHLWFLFI